MAGKDPFLEFLTNNYRQLLAFYSDLSPHITDIKNNSVATKNTVENIQNVKLPDITRESAKEHKNQNDINIDQFNELMRALDDLKRNSDNHKDAIQEITKNSYNRNTTEIKALSDNVSKISGDVSIISNLIKDDHEKLKICMEKMEKIDKIDPLIRYADKLSTWTGKITVTSVVTFIFFLMQFFSVTLNKHDDKTDSIQKIAQITQENQETKKELEMLIKKWVDVNEKGEKNDKGEKGDKKAVKVQKPKKEEEIKEE